jgi:hypothetical protein
MDKVQNCDSDMKIMFERLLKKFCVGMLTELLFQGQRPVNHAFMRTDMKFRVK